MKFSAWCRWCDVRIEWSTSRRMWDRNPPNKTYDDLNDQKVKCSKSKTTGLHDPNPKRS